MKTLRIIIKVIFLPFIGLYRGCRRVDAWIDGLFDHDKLTARELKERELDRVARFM